MPRPNLTPRRVALDVNPLLSPVRSGVPYYVESLVRALLTGDAEGMRFLFTADAAPQALHSVLTERDLPAAEDQIVPYRSFYQVEDRRHGEGKLSYLTRTAPDRLEKKWRKTLHLPPRRDLKLDVYHHTDYVAHDWAGAKCRHVMTIHDLIPVRFPEKCRPDWLWFAEKAYAFAKSRADAVITYSESSRRDILEHLKLPEERVHVIPLAVRESLTRSLAEETVAATLAGFGLERGRFLLAVGRLDPLKNLERLVEAFAQAADKDGMQGAKLVLTGPRSDASREDGQRRIEETLARRGLTDRCIFTGFVSDEQLSSLMRSCLVFVYPSLFEGFGIPPLEAMAQGAPVITSRVSSLPEVAGDAALLVDPYSVDEIADALLRVAQEPGLAETLRGAGLQQAARFSWERTADMHRQVYAG